MENLGFVHGNRSKKPAKTLDKSISENIILLYRNKYQDFNFTHFHEYLIEEENIQVSYNFVYTTLMAAGIRSPRVRKSTKRRLAKEKLENEKKLENKTEEEIEVIVNHEIALEDSHPRGERPKYFGEITEMDGSSHLWFGTNLDTTSVSQAKGLIERDNGTFQDRLISELRLNNITTIDKANEYLINIFVPKFNTKFALDYKKFDTVYEISPTAEKINYTLAVLSPRKIDNGNSLKFKNQYYQPYENNQLKCFKPKTKCLVIKAFDGQLFVTIDEKIYELRKLESHKKYSEEFDIVPEQAKEKKKYIPPMSHPWKLASFLEQMRKAHTQRIYA